MKITGVRIKRSTTQLKTPFVTSLRRISEIENILITLTTNSGEYGFGGASPTAAITGDTIGSITAGIEYIVEQLSGMDVGNIEALMEKINNSIVGNTSAKAAVDMAVYDLYGKKYSVPLYKILGGYRDQLQTDITISLNSPKQMAEDSIIAVKDGYNSLKIKLGENIHQDLKRMRAIKESIDSSVSLRIDANQGWKPKDAVEIIGLLKADGIVLDFIEQPVMAGDLDGMRFVRERVSIPVIADESVFSPADTLKLIEHNAADGINIKLMKSGGIYNAIKIANIAEAAGLFCMVGSMMESHTGLTAAAHFAASRSVVTETDLDVPLLCIIKPKTGGTEYSGQNITLPNTPGLGITGW